MDERVRGAVTALVVAAATTSVAMLLARDGDCDCVVRTDDGGLDVVVVAFVLSAVAAKGAAVTWWARASATTSRALIGLGVLASLAAASTWALGAWLHDPGWVGLDFLPNSADENATSMVFALDALLLLSLLAYATTVAACIAGRDRTARALAFLASTMTGLALVAAWRAFPSDVDGGPLFFLVDARLGGLAFRDAAASAVVVGLFAFFWPATDQRRGVTRLPRTSRSR